MRQKSVAVAYLLWFPLGLFGLHRYYLRRYCSAVLFTATIGIFGIGWIVDLFLIPAMVRECRVQQGVDAISRDVADLKKAQEAQRKEAEAKTKNAPKPSPFPKRAHAHTLTPELPPVYGGAAIGAAYPSLDDVP